MCSATSACCPRLLYGVTISIISAASWYHTTGIEFKNGHALPWPRIAPGAASAASSRWGAPLAATLASNGGSVMSSSEDIRVRIEELEKQSEKLRKESEEMTKRIEQLKDEIAKREA